MSTGTESEVYGFRGDCFRCGQSGHWADSTECPWLRKAATPKEHQARLDSFKMRFLEWEITPHQKREFIRQENQLWKVKA